MKVLVLGSSGQVGFSLTEYLRNKNYEVIEFDIVNNEEQDLRIYNNKLLEQNIQSSDFVVFLAFDVGGSRYLEKYQNTFDFVNNNNLIMQNTFSLLKKYSKELHKNRLILSRIYNEFKGKLISKDYLDGAGYNFNMLTHSLEDNNNKVYNFCFDFALCEFEPNQFQITNYQYEI